MAEQKQSNLTVDHYEFNGQESQLNIVTQVSQAKLVPNESEKDQDEDDDGLLGPRGMMKFEVALAKERAAMNEACDEIQDKIRREQTKNAYAKLEEKKFQRGEVKALNNFIYRQHEKLKLEMRTDDPNHNVKDFETTITKEEYKQALRRAEQNRNVTGLELANVLSKQRAMRTKSMGRSKVDTGYYDSMYERLLRAKQARDGASAETWEKFLAERENVAA